MFVIFWLYASIPAVGFLLHFTCVIAAFASNFLPRSIPSTPTRAASNAPVNRGRFSWATVITTSFAVVLISVFILAHTDVSRTTAANTTETQSIVEPDEPIPNANLTLERPLDDSPTEPTPSLTSPIQANRQLLSVERPPKTASPQLDVSAAKRSVPSEQPAKSESSQWLANHPELTELLIEAIHQFFGHPSGDSASKDVHVHSYTDKNGRYVPDYDRSPPRSK